MTDRNRPANKRRQFFVRAASILITAVLLLWLAGKVQWQDFDDLLGQVEPLSWCGALLAYLTLNLLRALRFRVLLDRQDAPYKLLIPITLYHNFLVRAAGRFGEMSYVVLLRARLRYSIEEGISSLFGARLLELLIIVLVFAFGFLSGAEELAAQRDELILAIALIFPSCLIALYFGGALLRALRRLLLPPLQRFGWSQISFVARLEARALQLATEMDRIRQPRLFLAALLISCGTYSCSFLTNYILLRALGLAVDLPTVIAIVSLGMFASAFPFSVSGLGVVQFAWAFALVQFAGWPDSDATATGFLLHGFQLFTAAIYGLVGYVLLHLGSPLAVADEAAEGQTIGQAAK